VAGQQLQDQEGGDGVAGVLDPTQHAQHVLYVRGFEELQTAIFDEGDIPAGEFDLKLIAVVAGTEQHRLMLQIDARLAMLQDALDHIIDLCCLVGRDDELRSLAGALV
jgi:hypothetical protein